MVFFRFVFEPMDELNSTPTPLPPDEDLTEVRKPTSLLIAQFFLFPLIIIGICVGIFLFFGYMTFEQKTPAEYLSQISKGSGNQRWQAAFELSTIVKSNPEKANTPEFVEKLSEAYKNSLDDDIPVRRYIALILGSFKDKSSVPMLSEGLRREDKLMSADWRNPGLFYWFRPTVEQIREDLIQNKIYTLYALGSIGDNAAVPVVLEFTKDREASVRKVAAFVLGSLQDKQADESLRVLLNDSKDDVKWTAAIALAQLNDSAGAELLMKLTDRSYVNALPDLTPDELSLLDPNAVDPRSVLMANAVKALGMLKHEPAKEKIRTLSESDPSSEVRKAALEALKKYEQ
jgi:HEAT repeat protein